MTRRRLNKRQRQRIAQSRARRRQHAIEKQTAAFAQTQSQDIFKGRIIVRHGQNLLVRDEQGAHHHCLLRANLDEAACGDNVLWQPTQGDQGVIIDILPRRTLLSRPDYSGRDKPLAANISQLLIVLAPQPAPTGYLTDQYLVAAELIGVRALIVLNKADLMNAEQWRDFSSRFAHYQQIGYPLISVSTRQSQGLQPLLPYLPEQTSILVGQSGVGKSSLINALIPDHKEAVGDLSDASGLGKHTTSIARLHFLKDQGEIIDSPGVRSFRLGRISIQQLEQGFPEFRPYLGQCRFKNCAHQNEPGCALKQAAEANNIAPQRLRNYLHMANKLRDNRAF